MIICWSAKGGSGTTVIAASLALLSSASTPTLLVDADGDVPAALGIPEPDGPGVLDWLTSSMADGASLQRLAVRVNEHLDVVARGTNTSVSPDRWPALAAATDAATTVVVDLGRRVPPPGLVCDGDLSLLILRPCYLALRRAVGLGAVPHGVVLVTEPGRALGGADVARSIGAPVVAEIPYDPALARLVDAGLLTARLPRTIAHPLQAIA